MDNPEYDPFSPGPFAVGVRTHQANDCGRGRIFPVETWYPARTTVDSRGDLPVPQRDVEPSGGRCPLIVFSHHSGGTRLSSTFLCAHLASHGYVVAAMDHSEVAAPELVRAGDETDSDRAVRIDNIIGSRVPDVRFLLDHLLAGDATARNADVPALDESCVGVVGHSLGGWTVLSAVESDARIRAAVALAPGGSPRPMPGVLPLTLSFNRHRDVPILFLAAANDTPIPLDRVIDVFDDTPGSKRMFVLARADHQHFVDAVEEEHEAIRAMSFPGSAAWIPEAMRPFADLASAEQGHLFVRGLTVAHLDATIRALDSAERFLATQVEIELAARGIAARRHRSTPGDGAARAGTVSPRSRATPTSGDRSPR